MAGSKSGGSKHGIPDDSASRKKIRDGLSDSEKVDFDAIVSRIDGGGKPDRNQSKLIRKWKNQGKIPTPSKRFKSRKDRRTHRDP